MNSWIAEPAPGDRLNHFLSELRRRNVVKVGTAYLAVAWLIVQLLGEIGPILDFPLWISRLALAVLALGFPVTVALAWIYELTDQGIRTTDEVDRDANLRPAFGRTLNAIVIVALTLALAYFVWESRLGGPRPSGPGIESIAVLPFKDLSPGGDQEYFAEGMAEELLNALSRVPELKVVGRSSSFAFKGSGEDLRRIAERLGVSHVLEGSVRTAGSKLRVTAQLIQARDGMQVWSRTFDRELSGVFAVQDDIANLVVEGLRNRNGESTASEWQSRTRTTDLNAYDQYLLGRYHLARRTADSIEAALRHLRLATSRDPSYSPAWSALAMTLVVSPYYTSVAPPLDLLAEIKSATQTAIELDASNSEAYAVLGTAHLLFERNWDQAAVELQKAVELHPNHAVNANLYGDYLYAIGDFESARHYEGLAAELEPLSAANQHEFALVLALLGRQQEAIERERLAVRLSPEFGNSWSALARMLLEAGQAEEARHVLAAQRESLGEKFALMLEAKLLMFEGDRDAARRVAERLLAMSAEQGSSLTHAAWLFASLGDDEQTAELVSQSYRRSDPILVSPLYFFLPEDWPQLPLLRQALAQPDLMELFDLRRKFVAAGRGRALHGTVQGGDGNR
jgi:TolB-like protein/Tfp pilus assembly protein PilF